MTGLRWAYFNCVIRSLRIALFFIPILKILLSCSPVSKITIEVLEPAEITIPSHINRVSFINRASYPVYDTGLASLYDRTDEEIYIIDTVCVNKQFEGFIDALKESPLFLMDNAYVIDLRRNDSVRNQNPLSSKEVHDLCMDNAADALFSLDFFRVKDTLEIDYSYGSDDYSGTLRISSIIIWRIYIDSTDSFLDEYLMHDTTEWIAYEQWWILLESSLPEMSNAFREASYTTGYKYGRRISPQWYEAERYYFRTGSKEMREAARMVKKNNWDAAAEIWKSEVNDEDKKIASRAAFNIALACEMDDLILTALNWAIKAFSTEENKFTIQYLEVLKQRKKTKDILMNQMPSRIQE